MYFYHLINRLYYYNYYNFRSDLGAILENFLMILRHFRAFYFLNSGLVKKRRPDYSKKK